MNSRVVRTYATLLFCLWLTELHSFLKWLFPDEMKSIVDHFLQPGYRFPYVSLEWWVKTTFDDFFVVIAFFVAAANMKNQKLAAIYRWLAMYYGLDAVMFYWNYKSQPGMFYCLLIVTSVILALLFVRRKPGATIIEMENNSNNGD
jgi:hypothetical protein